MAQCNLCKVTAYGTNESGLNREVVLLKKKYHVYPRVETALTINLLELAIQWKFSIRRVFPTYHLQATLMMSLVFNEAKVQNSSSLLTMRNKN